MNNDTPSKRAARRIRASQELMKLVRDNLQEAEASIMGCVDATAREELEATSEALNNMDYKLIDFMEMLQSMKRDEDTPKQLTEFDDLWQSSESVFKVK